MCCAQSQSKEVLDNNSYLEVSAYTITTRAEENRSSIKRVLTANKFE